MHEYIDCPKTFHVGASKKLKMFCERAPLKDVFSLLVLWRRVVEARKKGDLPVHLSEKIYANLSLALSSAQPILLILR